MKILSRIFLPLLVIAAFAPWCLSQTPQAPNVSLKIDEYLKGVWTAKKTGGSVLVGRAGKILYSGGFGPADLSANIPNSPTIRFRIGSLTKQFTAAGILILEERGKLSVTDPACKYLDRCPESWKAVTIHQLLTHTAGIPNITGLPEWRTKKSEDLSPSQAIDLVRDLPLRFTPGSDFEYSNSGYIMLGLIIEKVSASSYADFLQASIFDPLGMKNTGYDNGKPSAAKAVGYVPGPQGLLPAPPINMRAPFSAGSLYSTVGDLFIWSESLNTGKLLQKRTLERMFTPEKRNYGYGWGISTQNGRTLQSHAGGIDGFSSFIARYPGDNSVIIILTNNGAGMANTLGMDIAAILYGEKYDAPRERKEIVVDAAVLDTYMGRYEFGPGIAFVIGRRDGGLTFLPPGQPAAVDLYAESPTNFFLKVVDAEIKFIRDEAGKVTGLEYQQRGRTTRARRVE
jgi:CubicO group peptidase (beta-lactamase class C family)